MITSDPIRNALWHAAGYSVMEYLNLLAIYHLSMNRLALHNRYIEAWDRIYTMRHMGRRLRELDACAAWYLED